MARSKLVTEILNRPIPPRNHDFKVNDLVIINYMNLTEETKCVGKVVSLTKGNAIMVVILVGNKFSNPGEIQLTGPRQLRKI